MYLSVTKCTYLIRNAHLLSDSVSSKSDKVYLAMSTAQSDVDAVVLLFSGTGVVSLLKFVGLSSHTML